MPSTWHYGARVSDKEKEREEDEEPVATEGDDAPDGESDDTPDDSDAERAQRVAKALGVAEEDEGEGEGAEGAEAAEGEAEEKAEEAPPNRAQRRRDEALARRRKRKGDAAKKEAQGALPRDKNKRAKELLARRREAASAEPSAPSELDAGEMVDDVLARAWASTTKWLRKNLTMVQYVIAIAVVGIGGFVGYTYFSQKTLGEASSYLATGAMAERGLIVEKDRDDELKELDPTLVFKTVEERQDKALASYRMVEEKFGGSGAAILAKLGEAGVLLEKREWDKAMEIYDAVLKTPLAAADADVKGRAVEGIAFAKEGKGDIDGALAEVKKLENLDAKGYKELSQYHQARLLLAKGGEENVTKAKELLKAVYDKLKEPALDKKPLPYLQPAVEQALKKLDPSLVPDRETLGGNMSPEELQRQIRKLQEDMRNKQNGDSH